jgi:WD40 repeat protein
MKNKLRTLPFFSHTAQVLFALIAFQFPVIGYCDSGSGLIKSLFESKGKNMKDVAVKVAELHENEDINIWGLDFSPDGKYLAATSPNTVSMSSNRVEVQIWDWQNKRIVRTLEQVPGANNGLTTEPIRYSPDGRLLVACHGRSEDVVIRIWNTETWAVVHDITDFNYGSCNAIGFTPDGKSLIGILERNPTKPGDNLIVYDTTSWQPVWGLRTVPFYPKTLTISPDGKFIAIGGGVNNPQSWPFSTPKPTFGTPPLSNQSAIIVVDLAQRAIVRTIPNTVIFDFVGHLAWSPDGAHIAATGQQTWDENANGGKGAYIGATDTVMVFDAHSGEKVASEELITSRPSIRYTPDGKYLIEGDINGIRSHIGQGIRIWDGQHRELLQEIPGDTGGLAISRDGRYFAGGGYKQISVWQLK